MAVKLKVVISLFIIFAVVGILLFYPKTQSLTGNITAPIGSFFKNLSGKVGKPGLTKGTNILDISIKNVDPQSLGDIQLQSNWEDFEVEMNYDVISISDTTIALEESDVNIKIKGFSGIVSFFKNGNMKIEGKAGVVKINSMEISKPNMNLIIVGKPLNYEIRNIKKDKLLFSSISGSLKSSQLTGGMLELSGDRLELFNFDGNIIEKNGSVSISGQVSRMKLNNLDISRT